VLCIESTLENSFMIAPVAPFSFVHTGSHISQAKLLRCVAHHCRIARDFDTGALLPAKFWSQLETRDTVLIGHKSARCPKVEVKGCRQMFKF